MSVTSAHDVIAQALETLEEAKSEPTGGKWLEQLTAQIAPHTKEWDISQCCPTDGVHLKHCRTPVVCWVCGVVF